MNKAIDKKKQVAFYQMLRQYDTWQAKLDFELGTYKTEIREGEVLTLVVLRLCESHKHVKTKILTVSHKETGEEAIQEYINKIINDNYEVEMNLTWCRLIQAIFELMQSHVIDLSTRK